MTPEVSPNKTEIPFQEANEAVDSSVFASDSSLSERTWSEISTLKVAEAQALNNGDSEELIFTPLNYGTTSDTNHKPIMVAQAMPEDGEERAKDGDGEGQERAKEGNEDPPPKRQERDLEAIKKKLEEAFLNPNGTKKTPEQIVESLENTKLPDIKDIPELDKLEIPEIQDYVEFEPDLWHRIKENPLISMLVAYGGYQVIKQGRKFILKRSANKTEARGNANSEKAEKPSRQQPEKGKTQTNPAEERPQRRPRLLDSESATKFEQRVEAERNGQSGTFEKTVRSGSRAVLGAERASESLTHSEVNNLKQEIARLKSSKAPGDNRKAANLERVVGILENSKSPRVQEAAHKYIRNRMAEAEQAQRRKGLKGKAGAAIAIGILVSAALTYYNLNQNNEPDMEENERAGVSGR